MCHTHTLYTLFTQYALLHNVCDCLSVWLAEEEGREGVAPLVQLKELLLSWHVVVVVVVVRAC